MLHDGMIHWFGHGQQASLSVTYIEALHEKELEPIRNLSENIFIRKKNKTIFPQTWMCNSRGTGLTLGWKLNVAVVLQPSQWATSLALDKEELRATMRMGRSICDEMYLILEQMTSNTG